MQAFTTADCRRRKALTAREITPAHFEIASRLFVQTMMGMKKQLNEQEEGVGLNLQDKGLSAGAIGKQFAIGTTPCLTSLKTYKSTGHSVISKLAKVIIQQFGKFCNVSPLKASCLLFK